MVYRVQIIIGNSADATSPNYPGVEYLFYQGDQDTTGDGGMVLDNLSASWDSDPAWFPAQPDPSVASFAMFLPSDVGLAGKPRTSPGLHQGQEVSLFITGPGWSGSGRNAFLSWHGRVSDVKARPASRTGVDGITRAGLDYQVTCVDYRAALTEQRIGDEPWPAESVETRYQRIVAASQDPPNGSGLPWSVTTMKTGWQRPWLDARDVDATTTWDALKETLDEASMWSGYGNDFKSLIFNYPGSGAYRWETFLRWVRPIVVQRRAYGVTTFQLGYVRKAHRTMAALPYRLNKDGSGGAYLTEVEGLDALNDEAVILDAGYVERGVEWLQDKAMYPNAVRLEAPYQVFNSRTGNYQTLASIVAEDYAEIRRRGRVEQSRTARNSDEQTGWANAMMYLGDNNQTRPRWAFDSLTVRVTDIPDDAAWPRLFDPPTPSTDPNNEPYNDHPALGRFVMLRKTAAAWDLSAAPDYRGVLVGADVNLSGGVIRATIRVKPALPRPNGTTTGGITINDCADLLAGAPITIGGLASSPLTIADMALVRRPNE